MKIDYSGFCGLQKDIKIPICKYYCILNHSHWQIEWVLGLLRSQLILE